MSVVPAVRCPKCGGTVFDEIGRVEANSMGFGGPSEDEAIYECGNPFCGHEFVNTDEGAR